MSLKERYIVNSEMLISRSLENQAFPVTASLFARLCILYTVERFDDKSREPYVMIMNPYSIVELCKK